eukprot:3772572-Karenia_brevis.AAC.1
MAYVLRSLVPSWVDQGFGFVFGGVRILLAIWADDFTIVASGIAQLQIMLNDLGQALRASSISLNP